MGTVNLMAHAVDHQFDPVDYERFFDSLPNAYIAFLPDDPLFTVVADNEAHTRVALTTRAKTIGKPVLEAYPDNSEKYKTTGVSDLIESLRRVIATKQPDEMPLLNYDLKGADGTFVEKWWRVTHYPVFDASGKLTLLYQATIDITEEVLSTQKFELVQSQLDSALDIGLVSTWSLNMATNLVVGDKNLARSFGVPADQAATGLPLNMFTDSIHPDDRDRVLVAIQKSMAEDASYEEEYRTISKHDGQRWVIARGKMEKDMDGKPAFFTGVIVDITERKNAEAELVQIKSMFDALFESTILCIAMADLDGNILQANKTFLKTFGYTQSDLVRGFKSEFITPKKSRGITSQIYETLRLHGEAEPVEKEYIRKDGTPLPMLLGAAMLPGSSNQFMAFMLDISENKELKALNLAKDEFIGMASHQLRTPATVVKQYLSLLKTGFAGELTEPQQMYADKAFDSNERQLNIVNDLLKTAQIDSNRFLLKKQTVPVAELVANAVNELEDALEYKRQKVVTHHDADGAVVFVDKTELNLVLVNLIENASKYSPDDTTITIKTNIRKDTVCMAITDQGVGISKDNQRRIFQKFTRVDNKLSDTVTGSGLGLYWVEKIVNLHGGTIQVKSAAGTGSTFVVSLPYEA